MPTAIVDQLEKRKVYDSHKRISFARQLIAEALARSRVIRTGLRGYWTRLSEAVACCLA